MVKLIQKNLKRSFKGAIPILPLTWITKLKKTPSKNLTMLSHKQKAYKLLTVRKDGTIGPLFINRKLRIPIGEWLPAEDHPTNGYSHRPGWHVALKPFAPHLGIKNRAWYKVEVMEYQKLKRPKSQGGVWLIANWMRVIGPAMIIPS